MLTFLVPVVVMLGFFIGVLLARISPEEMHSGKRYFIWLIRLVVLIIIVSLFYIAGFGTVGLLLGLVFGFFVREYYFALGLAMAVALTVSKDVFFLFSALGFSFGVVYGTVSYITGRFTFTNVFTKIAFFFLPFCILFIEVPSQPLLLFAAGVLITILAVKNLPNLHVES